MIPTYILDDWQTLFTLLISHAIRDNNRAQKYLNEAIEEYREDILYSIENEQSLPEFTDYFNTDVYTENVAPTQLTIGFSFDTDTDTVTEWSYQTGDNSFTGGAYSFPHWIVLHITHGSTLSELWQEVNEQIDSLTQ